jgi:hypothetical protein
MEARWTCWHTLVVASDVDVIDAGFSDHLLLTTVITTQLLRPDLILYAFRNIHQADLFEFSNRLRRSDVHVRPMDDVDGFTRQLELSVTDVLDVLALLKACTKRRGKAESRCLSDTITKHSCISLTIYSQESSTPNG